MKKHELTSYMKLIAPSAVSLWTLAACGPPPGPVVSAYNGDSVHIIQLAFTSATGLQLLEMANSICQRGSKKFA